jgi:hypothetical protein
MGLGYVEGVTHYYVHHGIAFSLPETEGGKTKMLYIPKEKLDAVKKGVESYRE